MTTKVCGINFNRQITPLKYESQCCQERQENSCTQSLRGNPKAGKTTGEQILHYQNSGNTVQKLQQPHRALRVT